MATNIIVGTRFRRSSGSSGKLLAFKIVEELPNNPVALFSGPSHAEEVSRGVPTAMVLASKNNKL